MLRTYQKSISCLLIVSCIIVLSMGNMLYAQESVIIIVRPEVSTIEAGSNAIALTAKTSIKNAQYRWTHQGAGEISQRIDLPAVFYTPPDAISGNTAQAYITVQVTDQSGQQWSAGVQFTIIPNAAAQTREAKSVTETEPARGMAEQPGMSRRTKIALGAGAVVALGSGIALLSSGGDDDGDDPYGVCTFNSNAPQGDCQLDVSSLTASIPFYKDDTDIKTDVVSLQTNRGNLRFRYTGQASEDAKEIVLNGQSKAENVLENNGKSIKFDSSTLTIDDFSGNSGEARLKIMSNGNGHCDITWIGNWTKQ